MEESRIYTEREISYDVPISPSHFEKLKRNLVENSRYLELSLKENNVRFKIRIGTGGILRKTIQANGKHYLHTSLYGKFPPIVYSLKISQEETLDSVDLTWYEKAYSIIQIERYFNFVNGWRISVTRRINKSCHSTYWFNLEKENVSKVTEEIAEEFKQFLNEFWSDYSVPLLPRLPFREAQCGFVHTLKFPTEEVLYKNKIDGLNFIASFSDNGGWQSRCKNPSLVDSKLEQMKLKNNHIILFGEYTESVVYITELIYVRNNIAFVNLEEYSTLGCVKEDKLISVDLFNSAKAIQELAETEEPIFNLKFNTPIMGIPSPIISPECDGYLLVESAYRYSKLKIHHTIEVLMKDGFLFSRFSKLMIPLKVEKRVFQSSNQNKIIELKREGNLLSFVKIRTDKVLPDTIEKIWQILLL